MASYFTNSDMNLKDSYLDIQFTYQLTILLYLLFIDSFPFLFLSIYLRILILGYKLQFDFSF
jgi:hypothetical protein